MEVKENVNYKITISDFYIDDAKANYILIPGVRSHSYFYSACGLRFRRPNILSTISKIANRFFN